MKTPKMTLDRYLTLQNSYRSGYTPTGREHSMAARFLESYPRKCPRCGCETVSPFISVMIVHDVYKCSAEIDRRQRRNGR